MNTLDQGTRDGLMGIVLAGGLSSRLGQDKARLALGAEDMLTRSVKLLREVFPQVLVIGRIEPKLDALPGVECVADAMPRCGPIGGIVTALRHGGTGCLALSCDLPFITAPVLQKLVDAWAKKRPETLLYTYVQESTGKAENLVTIYSFAALRLFEDAIDNNTLKLSMVVPPEKRESLEYSFAESLPFFNINYPADLLLATEYLRLKNKDGVSSPCG